MQREYLGSISIEEEDENPIRDMKCKEENGIGNKKRKKDLNCVRTSHKNEFLQDLCCE